MNSSFGANLSSVYGPVPAAWVDQVRGFADYMDAPEAGTEYYCLNVSRAPLNDVRVRKALNMAIDVHTSNANPYIRELLTQRNAPGTF